MAAVYILYSGSLDKYYVGFTTDDITERLRRHNTNHKGFTGKANDWAIVFLESYKTKQEAMKREKAIKAMKSRKYIEQLVQSTPMQSEGSQVRTL